MINVALAYRRGEKVELKIPQFNIATKPNHEIVSKYFDKLFRAVSEKRRIVRNYTRPYGYIE